MVVRYIDCTNIDKEEVITLSKARHIHCGYLSENIRFQDFAVLCIFIDSFNNVETFFDEDDADSMCREWSIDGALKWYMYDYAEDEDVVFEELILKGDCIEIGTL